MSRRGVVTREQKVAKTIIDLLSDLRLDLDMVGVYLGKYTRTSIYMRLENVYEAAREERENPDSREELMEYYDSINA